MRQVEIPTDAANGMFCELLIRDRRFGSIPPRMNHCDVPAVPAQSSIAFFDIPYHSRLVTTLPLVRTLVERGHRVYGFTLPAYSELMRSFGAEVVLQPPFGIEPSDCTVNLRTIDYSLEAVPVLVEKLKELRPSLVIFTAKCLWAAIAAECCGIKTAVVHTNALMPRGATLSEAVYAVRWPDKSEAELAHLAARDQAAWERCKRHFAVEKVHDQDVLPGIPNCMNLRGDLNLVYTSDELQPQRPAFDETYYFVGPCYDQRQADEDLAFEAALDSLPRPLVYAALGSMRFYNDRQNLFRTVLDAFSDGEYGVVMAVGSAETAAALGPLPAHTLLRPYVPQRAVLQRTDVFVTHAGTNSVYESLLAGVPMLMLPQGGDQPIVAEHIEALGAGCWLRDPNLAAASLRTLTDAVLAEGTMAARARTLGHGLGQAGGVERAADLISAFIGPAADAILDEPETQRIGV